MDIVSHHVGRGGTELALVDPSDCSPAENPDNLTFGARGTLSVSSGTIARFEILPMNPLEFPVFDLVGRASATYSISVSARAPLELRVVCTPPQPVRSARVTCTASMSDGSEFTLTGLKSTADGATIFDGSVPEITNATAEWDGPAGVSTVVEFRGRVGAAAVVGSGSFTVLSRLGTPGWVEPDAPDFPASPPAPTFVNGAPLSAPYPGIVQNSSSQGGYLVAKGALGVTYFPYPTEVRLGKIAKGPNQGVILLTAVRWTVDPASGGTIPAIYVSDALRPTDPFFLRQTGPPPCARRRTWPHFAR